MDVPFPGSDVRSAIASLAPSLFVSDLSPISRSTFIRAADDVKPVRHFRNSRWSLGRRH